MTGHLLNVDHQIPSDHVSMGLKKKRHPEITYLPGNPIPSSNKWLEHRHGN